MDVVNAVRKFTNPRRTSVESISMFCDEQWITRLYCWWQIVIIQHLYLCVHFTNRCFFLSHSKTNILVMLKFSLNLSQRSCCCCCEPFPYTNARENSSPHHSMWTHTHKLLLYIDMISICCLDSFFTFDQFVVMQSGNFIAH